MKSGGGPSAKDFDKLFGLRPGWRLEPRSTPGAGPLWCFVVNGKIEFSVTAIGGSIHLYVMDTDQEIVFPDADALMAWLRVNRADAARERADRVTVKAPVPVPVPLPEDHGHEGVGLSTESGAGPSTIDFEELFGLRPGWRLEPRSTPGAGPLWCFVVNGKIEFSVTVEGGSIHLYVMETDQEIVFPDADALMAWLRDNRAEAAREPAERVPWKARGRRFMQWN